MELWDLVGEIVENQVSEHPRQASCEKRGTLPLMCYRTPEAVTELDDCVHTAPRGVDGGAAG